MENPSTPANLIRSYFPPLAMIRALLPRPMIETGLVIRTVSRTSTVKEAGMRSVPPSAGYTA